jgi:hypothetical protein
MHLQPTTVLALWILAMLSVPAASAHGTSQMKATASEKMMPADKAQKMRECLRWAEQRKIRMEDRSRFVDECVAGKAK